MKRTLSGKLQPTTPPVITGTDTKENLTEDTQASGDIPPPDTLGMRTHDADNGNQADWQAATWLHDDLLDDLLDELPDADTLLQMMPHTPPVERPRSPEASTGDVEGVQNEDAVQYLTPANTRAVFGVVAPYGEAPQAAIEKTV